MAHKGKIIVNKITGEYFEFLETAGETDGARLQFLFRVSPGGRLPVVHFHPRQTETFEMLSGVLQIEVKKVRSELSAGNKFVIEPGMPHVWCNPSATEPAELIVTFEPALNTEVFFEQWCGLCNDNKVNKKNKPYFFQVMCMMNLYQLYISGPPLLVQKIMGLILGGIARQLGYKSYYPEYSK